jgi:hypothetical protein
MKNSKTIAPGWYNWNQVVLMYCDGASFSGNLDGTVLTKDNTKLHFRGHRNLKAMMKWTLDHGLGEGTDLIVTGGSAGGLATFLHAAEWCHVFESNSLYEGGAMLDGQVQGKRRCVAIPNAGFFPDIQFISAKSESVWFSEKELSVLRGGRAGNYGNELRWVYSAQNVTVNHLCQEHNKGTDASKCMFAEHTAPFMSLPILVLNSVYDSWQIGRELPTRDEGLINKLGRLMIDRVTKSVLDVNPKSAAWLTGCDEHTVSPHWLTASVDGMRAPDVMVRWYSELGATSRPKRTWITKDVHPCLDDCCKNYEPSFQEALIE